MKPGKRVPRNVCKAFMLSSSIGAILMSHRNGEPRLEQLVRQVDRSMKVFYVQAGRKTYYDLTDAVKVLWNDIVVSFDGKIPEEDINAFIDYMCMLVPGKDFKDFLGISPYVTENRLDPILEKKLIFAVLEYGKKLDAYLGTKPYGVSLSSKPKVKKSKKIRSKAKSKKVVTKVSSAKLKRAEGTKRKKEFLAKLAADRLNREKESNGG